MLIACTSILSLFSSHLCFDQFIFTLCSLPYVHFHLSYSVFPSGFRMILDFFTLFLCFMSIFSCPAPYFPLVSGCFWTFLLLFSALCPFSPARFRISLWLFGEFWTFFLLFSALCPFSPARFRISLWLPDDFGLFPYFSLFYVHMEEYGRLRTAKSCTEADKKVSDHRLFVPKTAFPTAIIRIGKM